jgi:YfiH family protein
MSELTRAFLEKSTSFIRPNWPNLPVHVQAWTTTRKAGMSQGVYGDAEGQDGFNLANHVGDDVSHVHSNRKKLNKALPQDVIFLSQIHGSITVDAGLRRENCEADACYTAETDMPCAVLTADCLPVLFCDQEGTVVAAAHAGWRGLAEGVLRQVLQQMRLLTDTEISAWMGPAIGSQQFEVGADVKLAFERSMGNVQTHFQAQKQEGKYLADIYGLARQQLHQLGVKQVYGGEYCTVSQKDYFYSYRRDGVTGRMASLIWIGVK